MMTSETKPRTRVASDVRFSKELVAEIQHAGIREGAPGNRCSCTNLFTMRTNAIFALFMLFLCPVGAEVILSHSGANDPLSEGWTRLSGGAGVLAEPVVNDMGTRVDAWSVADSSTGAGFLVYEGQIATSQQARIAANGWKLSVVIRVIDLPTLTNGSQADDNSIAIKVRTGPGSRDFDLVMGYKVSHEKAALVANGISHWIDGFATIEVEYTPKVGEWGKAILTMSFDGDRRSTFPGASPNGTGPAHVSWGAYAAATTGHAHWAEVRFEILPDLVMPRISQFRLLSGNRQNYRITNIVRGVYYRVEKSEDLIDWEFEHGNRPGDYGDLEFTDNNEGPSVFYRVRIK